MTSRSVVVGAYDKTLIESLQNLRVGDEIDLTTQNLVRKKLIKKGSGDNNLFPKDGDQIFIHYTGKLRNGDIFTNTRKKTQDPPHSFILGSLEEDGEMIKGWNFAVKSMIVGEIASFTFRPKVAFSDIGDGGMVPPNATCIYEIELIKFNQKVNGHGNSNSSSSSSSSNSSNDGYIIKKVIQPKSKSSFSLNSPTYESKVKISYRLLGSAEDVDPIYEQKNVMIKLGEDVNTPPILEDIIELMKPAEEYQVEIISKFYIDSFLESINRGSSGSGKKYDKLLLIVNLHSLDSSNVIKDIKQLSAQQRYDEAMERKNAGNDYFKRQHYYQAIRKYQRGAEIACELEGIEQIAEQKKHKDLAATCLVNQSVVYSSIKQWNLVVQSTTTVLEKLDNKHRKALNLRGKAYRELYEYISSIKDFKKVLNEIDANDADATRELKTSHDLYKSYLEKEKKMYSNIMK
ncbi:hypothetical protein CYY_003139 [Polysphondylium violaceum]|uniref:peptidylprolyl isomerase n=1 Tax=Polysphondylium violaceum TaxID=133409 RepID=A0A8J4V1K9_9MYCE|nr:hypothetical protein CYY_003139 [Polysphondylium violaceum]